MNLSIGRVKMKKKLRQAHGVEQGDPSGQAHPKSAEHHATVVPKKEKREEALDASAPPPLGAWQSVMKESRTMSCDVPREEKAPPAPGGQHWVAALLRQGEYAETRRNL
jgi:hypothetical protein